MIIVLIILMQYNKYDIIIQIQIAVILAAVHFIWIPMFPTLVWLNSDLLKTLGIIVGIFPIIVMFFLLYLKNYYFPIVIEIPEIMSDEDIYSVG